MKSQGNDQVIRIHHLTINVCSKCENFDQSQGITKVSVILYQIASPNFTAIHPANVTIISPDNKVERLKCQ